MTTTQVTSTQWLLPCDYPVTTQWKLEKLEKFPFADQHRWEPMNLPALVAGPIWPTHQNHIAAELMEPFACTVGSMEPSPASPIGSSAAFTTLSGQWNPRLHLRANGVLDCTFEPMKFSTLPPGQWSPPDAPGGPPQRPATVYSVSGGHCEFRLIN